MAESELATEDSLWLQRDLASNPPVMPPAGEVSAEEEVEEALEELEDCLVNRGAGGGLRESRANHLLRRQVSSGGRLLGVRLRQERISAWHSGEIPDRRKVRLPEQMSLSCS